MLQEFVHEIKRTIAESVKGVHTAFPGKIISIDTVNCTATVLPVMKFKMPDGTAMDYPQISGVPIVLPQGNSQGATVAFPVKPGDGCLVIVSEQSIDYWMYGQETGTDLGFDLTNSICIPGLFSKPNGTFAKACESDSVIVSAGGANVQISSVGIVLNAGNVTVNGNLTVNGALNSNGVNMNTHSHTGYDGAETSGPH